MIRLRELSPQITTIRLTATLDSALCVGAGGSSGSLADKPILRNALGQLLIPASQLKGKLRHTCEQLVRGLELPTCLSPDPETMCPYPDPEAPANGNHQGHCLICQMFGNPSLPSHLIVDDLVCSLPELPEVLRPGVTLNRSRRTAEEHKLFFLETSPANVQLTFAGELHLLPGHPAAALPLLYAALKHIHALGGSKSAGLGWLHWTIDPPAPDPSLWQALKDAIDETDPADD